MSSRGTIHLVDDDEALRRATSRLLDSHGYAVRAFASADEFLAQFDPCHEGCLLLDVRMPGRTGFELQEALIARGVTLPIVFLTGHAEVSSSVRAMKQGAVDLLEKPVHEADLVQAIERALALDKKQRAQDGAQLQLKRRYDSLTVREQEVMAAVVKGQLNKQAAFNLGIAERTVKLHRARVLQKMRADSLADLVRMAEQLGIGRA
jgi:FixJ family two-component response regulator